MSGLDDALVQFVSFLDERAVAYMVIGGFANLQWGEPRTTLDLDVTVATDDALLIDVARGAGEILVEDPETFLARTRVLPVRLSDGTRVDLIAATLPYEKDAIDRAREVRVHSRMIRFCSPEDLIVHKIVSDRPRDHEDVAGIVRRQGRALDLEYLDPIIEGLSRDLSKPEILDRYRQAKEAAGL